MINWVRFAAAAVFLIPAYLIMGHYGVPFPVDVVVIFLAWVGEIAHEESGKLWKDRERAEVMRRWGERRRRP